MIDNKPLRSVERNIDLLKQDGSRIPGNILAEVFEDRIYECHVYVKCAGIEVKSTATNFFVALLEVRKQLQREGLKPICYGACRGVWPSGMEVDMNLGLSAIAILTQY